jgi:hypothetical protein
MNTIVRTIGGAIGSQVSAVIVTATLSGGVPTERGFTLAFATAAGALALGFVVALRVPPPVVAREEPVAEAA